ncbi:MAG: LacI family transcriptional regulator [Phycisphaerales bacterium]|nr:LacI family transcriptional regulator [Phycisphaerales bacterium]
MSSVRAIAKIAKVSVATVSRALNNHPDVDPATRDRVLSAANQSGYAPQMGKRLTTVIGLVYPGEPVKADYGAFDSAVLAGILRGVNDHKFDVKLINLQRDKSIEETYTQFFMRKGLRGIVLRTFENTRSICSAVAAEGFPSIVVADRFEDPRVNFICCDSKGDSRRAVEHLIQLGHRRIACCVHHVPDTDHRDRREGYAEALQDHAIPFDPALAYDIVGSFDGGVAAINRIMGQPRPPTAIYFTDPLATLGAMRRCQELDVRVPHDLSIVGFDDSDIRQHTWPPFTAVCQDAKMLGEEAARWLTASVLGQAPSRLRLIRQTMLEVNLTTAPPPKVQFRVLPDGTRLSVGETQS